MSKPRDWQDLANVPTADDRRRRLLLILARMSPLTEFALAGLLDSSTLSVHDDLLDLMAQGKVVPTAGRGLKTTWGIRHPWLCSYYSVLA